MCAVRWTWRYDVPDGLADESDGSAATPGGGAGVDTEPVGELGTPADAWAGPESSAREGDRDAFASQSDAETWLGLNWRRLAEVGVTEVELIEDDRVVYAMSLAS